VTGVGATGRFLREGAPRRVHMPRLANGQPCPNPIRWVCTQGHIHPSRQAAIKCNYRTRSLPLGNGAE
jgi:hypothetical protein